MNCPIHSLPFSLVPGGVSKTSGKSYAAFWACQMRGCKERPPREAQPATVTPAQSLAIQGAIQAEKPTTPNLDRMIAALDFAARCYQGKAEPAIHEDILALAQRAFEKMGRE